MNGQVSKRIRNAAQVCTSALKGSYHQHVKRLKAEYRLQPYHKRDDIAAMLGRPVPSHSEALRIYHQRRA